MTPLPVPNVPNTIGATVAPPPGRAGAPGADGATATCADDRDSAPALADSCSRPTREPHPPATSTVATPATAYRHHVRISPSPCRRHRPLLNERSASHSNGDDPACKAGSGAVRKGRTVGPSPGSL